MLSFLTTAAVLACILQVSHCIVEGPTGPIQVDVEHNRWQEVLSDPPVPSYELDALRDLYDSTNGQHWVWDSKYFDLGIPWNFSGNPNPCEPPWQGIACSTLSTEGFLHIVRMDLREHNLTGQLPPSLFNLTQLTNIVLTVNSLTGSIPSTIGQLTLCRELGFNRNALSGTIPEEIGQLASAEIIDLAGNRLHGKIPTVISTISTLRILRFSVNRLSGTLLAEFGNMRSLLQLSLEGNTFHGTIPATYGQWPNLTNIYLSRNQLTGTLPAFLVQLPDLISVDFGGNQFSGTLPDVSAQTRLLQQIVASSNRFSGTVPASWLQLASMRRLYLFNNLLSGTVPDSFAADSRLALLELGHNRLSGTFPSTICTVTHINEISLRLNYLTGTIPEEIGNLDELIGFEISQNSITGTISAGIGKLRNATNIYLSGNFLDGTLPDEVGQLSRISYLYFAQNLLSGTLPTALSRLASLVTFLAQDNIFSGSVAGVFVGELQPRLELIKLSGNKISGPVPKQLFSLSSLVTIFLDNNHFTGSLEGVFNASRQPLVTTVQFSNNQLTGTIPDELFVLPQLKTVVLGSNCFSGSLPVSACTRQALTTLSLDGLRSASSCQRVILPGLSSAYLSVDNTPGGLPTCLLQMPNLVALHLSGNGLTGTLPENANLSSALVDLSLSHNRLTGSIPHYIQRRTWYNLDLSYNKFNGDLTRDFASIAGNFTILDRLQNTSRFSDANEQTRAALSLRNNRLSSHVPSEIKSMHNVSVLSGNLFSCHLDGSDLPPHDSGKATYQCGSTSFDIPYYLWLSAVAAIILMVSAAYHWRQRFEARIGSTIITCQRWLTVVARYEQENPQDACRLQHYKYLIRVREAVCEVALWSTSFIVVIFLPLYAILSDQYGTHSYAYAYTVSAAFLSGPVPLAVLLTFFLCLVAFLVWLVTTRLRALHEMEGDSQEASQDLAKTEPTCPTLEKATIYVVFFLINFAIVLGANIAYVYVVLYENSDYNVFAQIALSVFKLLWNNAGVLYLLRWTRRCITCSAPQGSDDSNDSVSGFFGIQLFVSLFNFIAIPCLVVGTVSPSCFNNLLVRASPVETSFFYEECILYTTALACDASVPQTSSTSYSPPFTYSYQCSSSLITYYAPSFIYMALIVTFVNPALKAALLWTYQRRVRGTWLATVLETLTPLVLRDPDASYGATDPSMTTGGMPQMVVDGHRSLVILSTNVGVLLTFGLVFPPIAAAMLVAINVTVLVRKIEVGRFLTNAMDDQNLHKYLDAINNECRGVGDTVKLRRAALTLLAFMCFFYAPFLFDTLGDRAGAERTAWVVVVLAALPAAVHFFTAACSARSSPPRAAQEKEREDNPSVEMRESSATNSVDRQVVSALHA